jgi:hypothetical protein
MSSPTADDGDDGNERIIGREKAERYARILRDELKGMVEEEDVRTATYHFLASLAQEVAVNVKIRNERVVLSGGRIDSLFEDIIFEFKKPDYFKAQAGRVEAVEGRKTGDKRQGGIIEYLISLAVEESGSLEDFQKHLSAKIGIGFDGVAFVFVRFVASEGNEYALNQFKQRILAKGKGVPTWLPDQIDGVFSETFQPDMKVGLRYLYLHIRAISPRDPLKPINISKRFGEKSPNFPRHMTAIYRLLAQSLKEPHVETLYEEWNRVFGKVYGEAGEATREVRDQLADEYEGVIDFKLGGGPKPPTAHILASHLLQHHPQVLGLRAPVVPS